MTICAISTPPGIGGIAIIRISGPEAIAIADRVWRGKSLGEAASHTAHLGVIVDPSTGNELDQAVATLFRGPRSFTGEDVVEFSVHGSRWIQTELINLLIRNGCRLADAGEFTRRAFTNGRIDLAEAEAVADVIAAESEAANRVAQQQLRGSFSRCLGRLRDGLVELASLIELELDFAEEHVEFADRGRLLALARETLATVDSLSASFATGQAIKNGIPVAIVGAPNAGKSSLLNLLLHDDRAIVSDIPGTTRDIVEDTIRLGDIVLNLADTAGLRDTDDPVEKVGVELARKRLDTSYLVLAVFDSSEELSAEDMELIEKIKDRPVVAVINKSDLSRKIDVEKIRQKIPHIAELSASAGEGVAELEAQVRALLHLTDLDSSASVIANERQRACVEQASRTMDQALEALQAGQTLDAINVCIDSAIDSLLELTGERASDAVIDQVFARFCVGK